MTDINIDKIEYKLLKIEKYLEEHDIEANYVDILDASLDLAKRMGAGNWSFVCELKHRREEE